MQKPPTVQSSQAVWPGPAWYLPAAQRVQIDMLLLGANEPGEHQPGWAEPVAHAAPAGHSTQSSCEVIGRASVMFWWRPDGHGSGAAAPTAQYEPVVQSSHVVRPGRS